ncbi:MAG: hypothetical protein WAX66_03625 [Patescibacteria group bacterium]
MNNVADVPSPPSGENISEKPKLDGNPEISELSKSQFSVFLKEFPSDIRRVYYPCCALDVTPSEVFNNGSMNVLYLDTNPAVVKTLNKFGYNAKEASALEYNPGEMDLVIMLNPQISAKVPANFVKEGGYFLCNNYHGTADEAFNSMKDLELIGVISSKESAVDRIDLSGYFEEVTTDEEFLRAPWSWNLANFSEAAEIVKAIKGTDKDILSNYKDIINESRNDLSKGDPKLMRIFDSMGQVQINHNGKSYSLDTMLPRKKGNDLDLFVFRKRSRV